MKIIIVKGLVRHYLKLVAKNGEMLMHSEHYFSLPNARRAAHNLAKELRAGKATVEEQ